MRFRIGITSTVNTLRGEQTHSDVGIPVSINSILVVLVVLIKLTKTKTKDISCHTILFQLVFVLFEV